MTNDKDSLEDLAKHDPPPSFLKGARVAISFLWKFKVCKKIHPTKMLAAYVGIGAMVIGLPKEAKFLQRGLKTVGLLPILGGAVMATAASLMVSMNRKAALDSTQEMFLERLKSKRAERYKDKYDVFFPPNTEKPMTGIIFFPGALVSHTAYASIAAALSDKGLLVVVVSLEPVRFVAETDVNRQIASDAMKDIVHMHPELRIEEWVTAGHSAGAMSALNLAMENEETVLHPSLCKVVLCGIGENPPGDASKTLRNSKKPFSVLVVNASNDTLVNSVAQDVHQNFLNMLPEESEDDKSDSFTKFVTIEGGNHGHFGSYTPQASNDGEPTIPMEEQQKVFVETTAEFLLK